MSEAVLVATLDAFVRAVKEDQGIGLAELGVGRTVVVETRNSIYEITVVNLNDGTISVKGSGSFFARPTTCVLSGSTFGGSMIKMRWIGLGMLMEFHLSTNERLITSPVKSIGLLGPTAPSGTVH